MPVSFKSVSRIHYKSMILFVNELCIHYGSVNNGPLSLSRIHHKSLSVSRIYNESIYYLRINYKMKIFLADSLLIHHLFRDFTNCFALWLKIHHLFREFNFNSLSFSRLYWEFTICSRIYNEFTIYSENSLWNYFFENSIWIPLVFC